MSNFSKKSLEDFKKAQRRFNSMRTRASNTLALTITTEKVTNDILKSFSSTEELRSFIKTLSDYRTLADFKQSPKVSFPATIGEVRTFNRVRGIAQRKNLKLAKQKRVELSNKLQNLKEGEHLNISVLSSEITSLTTPRLNLSKIQNRKSLLKANIANTKATLSFDYGGWNLYRTNYILELRKIPNYTEDIEIAVLKMNTKKFADWITSSPFTDIEEWYLSQSIGSLNRIRGLLNIDIQELTDNFDIDYEELI